ncbi:uncharacterized protein HKW66_Vig0221710 [Vigna angularis]|uniref:TOD1/MUCI70 glycosyltransferase-like domain-containing protein n=1 Tax=Phaseolus angularis TaxID=3914 RepID=A0A8T0K2U2_PHAAN|nr:uncharacterized protein HKW66_Vig0221710 [Vigna angularis]
MFQNKSVSISLSDEESDELGRMRVRARRKRKKLGNRRLLRKLFVRYWMLLVIVPAAGLFIFEATRIGRSLNGLNTNSRIETRTHRIDGSSPTLRKAPTNLNRLDPTTHVVAGIRERCLKLLPPEKLEQLDIPVEQESSRIPVGEVLYMSESDRSFVGANVTLSQLRTEDTRFNLFTGNQTFEERDRSFEVKETMTVHCGFFSVNGGFKISDQDKSYMQGCKVVVSTCAFGGGDDLYQPIGMSEASLKKVCYVAFWDEITVKAQELVERRIGENGFIGNWRVVVMLSHRLFPQAKYSIWVDSKSQFRRDPLGVLETLLWRPKSLLAISEHGARSSVYDEAKAVVKKNKAKPEEVEVQLNQYRKDGLPEDKRFNGKKALCEASVIIRKHTPLTNLLMCVWFNEVVRFTSRDQLSFPYVLWRLKAFQNINTFPVCTRKDLVNSMGHVRKAKPLQG